MMKFCEMFHISPNEYYLIPSKTVDLFFMMKNLEGQFENEQRITGSSKRKG